MSIAVRFFATASDLLPALTALENKVPVSIVEAGLFDKAQVRSIEVMANLPYLGLAKANQSSQLPSYLVVRRESKIDIRPIKLTTGGIRYAVDQLHNPGSAILQPGGLFEEKVLLAGEFSSAHSDPESRRLVDAFRALVKKSFKRVNAYWVGPEAYERWKGGLRLTFNASAGREYDLAEIEA